MTEPPDDACGWNSDLTTFIDSEPKAVRIKLEHFVRSPGTEQVRAWDDSIAAFREDRAALEALATDESIDLFAKIPHGDGQTYLREILLVADHNAYHLGQLVTLRQQLGAWGTA